MALVLAFGLAKSTEFLMPGALSSAHGAIEDCNACHTKSGKGKLSWMHGLVAGDRIADSKACLACHQMPDTAFKAHGAGEDTLLKSTMRLTSIAARTPVPSAARAQSVAFPAETVNVRGLYCTTCHQEHQGAAFDLKAVSNEQCRSCHVVKFDSFDGHHPQFDDYPFRRRTRIIFDHARHFRSHFPELAKKNATKHIPATCSTCHDSNKVRQVMAVAPFERTCTACHLDQIMGNERASGPKGIAFLALPGLDVQTLKSKNAAIGEWPSDSEAGLTPFMKMMIGRSGRGRELISTIDGVNLQDLAGASQKQIKAVSDLVWEIKGLIYALIKGNVSNLLPKRPERSGDLDPNLLADLTAALPRDVMIGAYQQWLPNLGAEMASRPKTDEQSPDGWTTTVEGAATVLANTQSIGPAPQPDSRGNAKRVARVNAEAESPATTPTPEAATTKTSTTTIAPPQKKSADQTDDLLNPTPEEIRAMAADAKGAAKGGVGDVPRPAPTAPPDRTSPPIEPATPKAEASGPIASAAPVASFAGDVDAETWAAQGGWYRQDYAIFYRPTGHRDRFIYTWLEITGPQSAKGDASPAGAIFNSLTDKDAQGSCTKCHSVDDMGARGRRVNFSPVSIEKKRGRFTNFVHEPHLSVLGEKGCLTCHDLKTDGAYLKGYEQGDPLRFVSNFSNAKKELCATCHTKSKTRQDCLTCHKYHIHGVVTPIMQTKIPAP